MSDPNQEVTNIVRVDEHWKSEARRFIAHGPPPTPTRSRPVPDIGHVMAMFLAAVAEQIKPRGGGPANKESVLFLAQMFEFTVGKMKGNLTRQEADKVMEAVGTLNDMLAGRRV